MFSIILNPNLMFSFTLYRILMYYVVYVMKKWGFEKSLLKFCANRIFMFFIILNRILIVTINLTKAEIAYNSSGSDLINDYEIHCY